MMYGFGPNYEKRVLSGYRLTRSMEFVGSGSFFINTTFSTGPSGGALPEKEIIGIEEEGEYLVILNVIPVMAGYRPGMKLEVVIGGETSNFTRTLRNHSTYNSLGLSDGSQRTGGFCQAAGTVRGADGETIRFNSKIWCYGSVVRLGVCWSVYKIS